MPGFGGYLQASGTALIGASAEDAGIAAGIGASGCQNNYLSHAESGERELAWQGCEGGDAEACEALQAWNQLDTARDVALVLACADPSAPGCNTHLHSLVDASQTYGADPHYELGLAGVDILQTAGVVDDGSVQAWVDAAGGADVISSAAIEQTEIDQIFEMFESSGSHGPALAQVLGEQYVADNPALIRLAGGFAAAGRDTVAGAIELGTVLVTDPGAVADSISAIIDNPSILADAIAEPYNTRLAYGDTAGAGGYAAGALLEVLAGTKGLGKVAGVVPSATTTLSDVFTNNLSDLVVGFARDQDSGVRLPGGSGNNSDGVVSVYRVFGDDARAEGFSWTTVDPRTVDNFRDATGLPSGGASGANKSANFLLQGQANLNDILEARPALPLDGNVGGLNELIIDPANVNLTDFSILNP